MRPGSERDVAEIDDVGAGRSVGAGARGDDLAAVDHDDPRARRRRRDLPSKRRAALTTIGLAEAVVDRARTTAALRNMRRSYRIATASTSRTGTTTSAARPTWRASRPRCASSSRRCRTRTRPSCSMTRWARTRTATRRLLARRPGAVSYCAHEASAPAGKSRRVWWCEAHGTAAASTTASARDHARAARDAAEPKPQARRRSSSSDAARRRLDEGHDPQAVERHDRLLSPDREAAVDRRARRGARRQPQRSRAVDGPRALPRAHAVQGHDAARHARLREGEAAPRPDRAALRGPAQAGRGPRQDPQGDRHRDARVGGVRRSRTSSTSSTRAWASPASTRSRTTTRRYTSPRSQNRIAQWAKVEAHRYADAVFRLFWPELEAVYEEKNRSIDNPGRRTREAFLKAMFPKHGYGWSSTLGELEHLKSPAYQDMEAFFKRYYTPRQHGDPARRRRRRVGAAAAREGVRRVQAPGRRRDGSGHGTPLPAGRTEIKVTVPSQEGVLLGWPLVAATHADRMALELMDLLLLDGQSGILARDLLLPQKVADAGCNPTFLREAGYYELTPTRSTVSARRPRAAAARPRREAPEGRLHRRRRRDRDPHRRDRAAALLRVQRRPHGPDGEAFIAGEDWRHGVEASTACGRSPRPTSCASRTSTSPQELPRDEAR